MREEITLNKNLFLNCHLILANEEMRKKILFYVLISVFMGLSLSISQPVGLRDDYEIGIIERLGEQVPLDLLFRDESGDTLRLNDFITGPVVVSLVYFNCPGICSPLLGGMVDVLDRMDLKPGQDYQAVTISFDPSDTPDLARDKKRNYFKSFRRGPFPEDQWKWVTADSLTIRKFTDAVGFKYRQEGRDFIHAAALIVLSRDGTISRYLRGIEFQPFDLKMAITEASQGRVGPTISKVLLYCFSYDPAGKKYVFNVTKVGGTIFLILLIIFIAFLIFRRPGKKVESEVLNG